MKTLAVKFAEAARSYVGTPFHWHGRVPGVGLDCSGVIVCAGREIGLEFPSPKKYTRSDQCEVIFECLSTFCKRINPNNVTLKTGDILVFEVSDGPGHIMVVYEASVIHASDEACFKAVVQQPLTEQMIESASAAYRLEVKQ